DLPHVVELELPEAARDVEAAAQQEEREVRVEVEARHREEQRDDDVGEQRAEVRHQLLAQHRDHAAFDSPAREPGPSTRTRRRKISSSDSDSRVNSRMTKPRAVTARDTSRMVASSFAWKRQRPSPSSRSRTPGTAAMVSRTSDAGPSARSQTRTAPSMRRARPSGVSSATTRPRLMITTRCATWLTSDRMWLEKTIVRWPRRLFTSS